MIGHGLGAVGIVGAADFHSARTDDFVLRNGELYIVDAEVGEEFGGVVILVAVPGSMPADADFRKPLSAEEKIALPPERACVSGNFV